MALIEHQNLLKHSKFDTLIGKNYELAVEKSIQNLVDALRIPNSDFSVFASSFHELLQARVDPPLETIWYYSALTFRKPNSQKDDTLDQCSAIKDLFHSITSCSASSWSLKSVALIAPVIYELYVIIAGLKGKEVGFKREKKVLKEIKSLIDVILGYINVCCCQSANDSDELIRPLGDLVSVWIPNNMTDCEGEKAGLRLFFPLLNDEIIEGLSVEECDVRELAGVVIAEAFVLKLCLEFLGGTSRKELQKELKNWAIGSITGLQNVLFFEILVKMLLKPTLPVTSLLSSEDEILLRNVLYDSLILVEYSFLNAERVVHLATKHIKSLAMARLMVTHEAAELFRGNGDHTKAISYIIAFSSSHLPSELIKLVTSEIGMGEKVSGPNGSSPKAILKWLYNLEDQGIRLLDFGMSKYRARLVVDSLKVDSEQPDDQANGNTSDADLMFYIDNRGKDDDQIVENDKTNEPISAAFVAAAHTMQSTENDGRRKRKDGRGKSFEKKQMKFLKYNLYEHANSVGPKSTSLGKDDSSSGNEVENPVSDEDIEVNEQ